MLEILATVGLAATGLEALAQASPQKLAAEVPVRFGLWLDEPQVTAARPLGWSFHPPGIRVQAKMSGLVWPEAETRLANSAALVRHGLGRGQIILFASPPAWRAFRLGTMRLLTNALVYGSAGVVRTVLP